MKKNIAIFVKNLTSGGAEKQAVLLAKSICEDYDVHFIIFNACKVHQKYLDLLLAEPRVSLVSFRGGHMSRFCQFVSYVRKADIDVIFSYLVAANLYACIARCLTGVKVYTGLRNVELPWKKRLVDYFLTNFIASGTIANSFTGKENFVRHGFPQGKIIVIPNGFENCRPYQIRTIKETVRIITVGRFHPQKDYNTAIRSFAKLHKMCPNTFYDIVGYGDEELFIRTLVANLGLASCCNIYINPDNIPELLDNADIYLSTSLVEGTSNSIMEAMNADMPVVATNVGDNCYLVEDGISGYVLSVKDIDGLAEKMMLLTKDYSLRMEMGKEAKKILQDRYSVESFKFNYVKVIE